MAWPGSADRSVTAGGDRLLRAHVKSPRRSDQAAQLDHPALRAAGRQNPSWFDRAGDADRSRRRSYRSTGQKLGQPRDERHPAGSEPWFARKLNRAKQEPGERPTGGAGNRIGARAVRCDARAVGYGAGAVGCGAGAVGCGAGAVGYDTGAVGYDTGAVGYGAGAVGCGAGQSGTTPGQSGTTRGAGGRTIPALTADHRLDPTSALSA